MADVVFTTPSLRLTTPRGLPQARGKERDYKIFLGNALAAVREIGVEGPQNWTDIDKAACSCDANDAAMVL